MESFLEQHFTVMQLNVFYKTYVSMGCRSPKNAKLLKQKSKGKILFFYGRGRVKNSSKNRFTFKALEVRNLDL